MDTRLRGFWRGLFQGRFDSIQLPLNEVLGSKDNMQAAGFATRAVPCGSGQSCSNPLWRGADPTPTSQQLI